MGPLQNRSPSRRRGKNDRGVTKRMKLKRRRPRQRRRTGRLKAPPQCLIMSTLDKKEVSNISVSQCRPLNWWSVSLNWNLSDTTSSREPLWRGNCLICHLISSCCYQTGPLFLKNQAPSRFTVWITASLLVWLALSNDENLPCSLLSASNFSTRLMICLFCLFVLP